MPLTVDVVDAEWFEYHTKSLSNSPSQQQQKHQQQPTSSHHREDTTTRLPRVIVEARDVVSDLDEDRGFERHHDRHHHHASSQQHTRRQPREPMASSSSLTSIHRHTTGRHQRSQSVIRGSQPQSRSRSRTLSPLRTTSHGSNTNERYNYRHQEYYHHSRDNNENPPEHGSVEIVLAPSPEDGNTRKATSSKQQPQGSGSNNSGSGKKNTTTSTSHGSSNSNPHSSKNHSNTTPRSILYTDDEPSPMSRDGAQSGFETSPIYNKVRQRESMVNKQHRMNGIAEEPPSSNHHTRRGDNNNNDNSILMNSPIYNYSGPPGHSSSSLTSMTSSRFPGGLHSPTTATTTTPTSAAAAGQSSTPPPVSQQQQQRRQDPERFPHQQQSDTAVLKKQRQSARGGGGGVAPHLPRKMVGTDISSTDGRGALRMMMTSPRSISESSAAVSPNVIYQALRSGNSGTLSQILVSPHNLSEALRESASETSVFGDFHNPNNNDDSEDHNPRGRLLPTPPGTASRAGGRGRRHTTTSRSYHGDDTASVNTTTSSVLKQRLVVKTESQSFDSSEEMTYYHYVSRHSILQLCTEDLMSDNWKLVDYALYRLCEVCCTLGGAPTSPPTPSDGTTNNNNSEESQKKLAAANRIRFIKAGGHALIVGVMKKFATIADLQTSACRFIQNLFSLDQEGAFKELFASVYGMDCVLAAIHHFTVAEDGDANDEVHRYACGALVSIVCSSFKMVQRLMQDPRNLRVFFQAMHTGTTNDDTGTTVGICRIVNYISKHPEYHRAVLDAGGLEELVGEMKLYPENKKVQCSGCEALGNIVQNSNSVSSDTVDHIVNQLEGATLIGVAMKAFPKWEDLQEKAAFALFHLSAYRAAQTAIKKAAGLSILGAALENFPNNQSIQNHGRVAMQRLLEAGAVSTGSN